MKLIEPLKKDWEYPYSQLVNKINELVQVHNNSVVNKPVTTTNEVPQYVSVEHLKKIKSSVKTLLERAERGDYKQSIYSFDLTMTLKAINNALGDIV